MSRKKTILYLARMKPVNAKGIEYFISIVMVLGFSCDKNEDPCFNLVCYGLKSAECVIEPNTGSAGCFAPTSRF